MESAFILGCNPIISPILSQKWDVCLRFLLKKAFFKAHFNFGEGIDLALETKRSK